MAWSDKNRDLIKMLGFSRLNMNCLLDASGLKPSPGESQVALLEQSLNYLGPRFSAVVIAVNFGCSVTAGSAAPEKRGFLMNEIITYIEIGYKMGLRVPEVGPEGGALMGFAALIGDLLFLAENPDKYLQLSRLSDKSETEAFEKEAFGCQRFQSAAFAMQNLGFGTKVALGTTLALGGISPQKLNLTGREEELIWRACLLWVEALREGRGYPADPEVREFFREITPPRDKQQKNTVLEVLYTEVAKLKNQGSEWRWHQPRIVSA